MNKCIKQGIQVSMCTLVLTITACSQDGVESSADKTTASGDPSQRLHEIDTNASILGKTQDQQISDAVTDLSVRAGISVDSISVIQARAVSWASSALGCPKEGMNYTQAIVPGVLLLLDANGVIYHYHGRSGKSLFYCPDERAKAPAYGPGQEIM